MELKTALDIHLLGRYLSISVSVETWLRDASARSSCKEHVLFCILNQRAYSCTVLFSPVCCFTVGWRPHNTHILNIGNRILQFSRHASWIGNRQGLGEQIQAMSVRQVAALDCDTYEFDNAETLIVNGAVDKKGDTLEDKETRRQTEAFFHSQISDLDHSLRIQYLWGPHRSI